MLNHVETPLHAFVERAACQPGLVASWPAERFRKPKQHSKWLNSLRRKCRVAEISKTWALARCAA